jgi:hypothetical protein
VRAARLLGRHVHRRAQRRARQGDAPRIEHPAGDAEIEHLHLGEITSGEEEVGGLDVAVDDPLAVGHRQPLERAPGEPRALQQPDPPLEQTILERLALEPLHRQVVLARAGDAVIDVANDGRMGELRQQRRFLIEAIRGAPLVPHEHLERHAVARVHVHGAVDGAHTSGAGLLFDPEALGKHSGTSGVHPTLTSSISSPRLKTRDAMLQGIRGGTDPE